MVLFAVLCGNYDRCFVGFYDSKGVITGGKYGILKQMGLVTCTTDGLVYNICKFWTHAKKLSKQGTAKNSET